MTQTIEQRLDAIVVETSPYQTLNELAAAFNTHAYFISKDTMTSKELRSCDCDSEDYIEQ